MYDRIIFANNIFPNFDPLTATGMALYVKMLQNVKIYLAFTEAKRNRIPLSLRLRGIR
jgi:hypothetical protein